MSDPVAKAKALEDLAIGEKRRTFQRLKAEAPDVAEFVTAISQAFGKPDAITIRFRDGERYQSGRFMAAQNYPDFRSQEPLWQRRRSR
jgi:hypothetical protein